MTWITVKEALPPKGKLVKLKRYHGEVIPRVLLDLENNGWKYNSGLHACFLDTSDVWMPLPELPEEKV